VLYRASSVVEELSATASPPRPPLPAPLWTLPPEPPVAEALASVGPLVLVASFGTVVSPD